MWITWSVVKCKEDDAKTTEQKDREDFSGGVMITESMIRSRDNSSEFAS